MDLKSIQDRKKPEDGDYLASKSRNLQTTIETVPKVVIGMIHGYCLTGALEIALSCDLLVAAEDAKLGDTHTKWGLHPTWGMSQRLPQRVGELKARELSYTSEMVSGIEAERIGLVNKAVPLEQLKETVKKMAKQISGNSLDAVAAHKHLYNTSKRESMEKGLEREYSTVPEIRDLEQRTAAFGKKS